MRCFFFFFFLTVFARPVNTTSLFFHGQRGTRFLIAPYITIVIIKKILLRTACPRTRVCRFTLNRIDETRARAINFPPCRRRAIYHSTPRIVRGARRDRAPSGYAAPYIRTNRTTPENRIIYTIIASHRRSYVFVRVLLYESSGKNWRSCPTALGVHTPVTNIF